eukprot:TRINITY_DN3595_c0_g1_i1.p1 TRINITY_DN3595_c0_g1~~TRINITY_DN3595_c0_g1_i1.p1  ORF type:complete len:204 (-),score=27.71 TRINITY_DN3595_c0_g1_i1:28-639(-)
MDKPVTATEIITTTSVPGLILVKNFLTEKEEDELLAVIDAPNAPWKLNRSRTRRVQMFGPLHDSRYTVKQGAEITPLPSYSPDLTKKIITFCWEHFHQFQLSKLNNDKYTELFVNEYTSNDALQFHKDHTSTYGPVIIGISLLCDGIFWFQKGSNEEQIKLPRRSMYLMTGDSRTSWNHGIHAGHLSGERRISLTFRTVNYKK